MWIRGRESQRSRPNDTSAHAWFPLLRESRVIDIIDLPVVIDFLRILIIYKGYIQSRPMKIQNAWNRKHF